MPIPFPQPRSKVVPGPGCRPVSSEARAYCGPAHGAQWTVTDPEPPAWVELPCGASSALYRLVRRPHSARPVRDGLGNYLYVPMTGDPTESADESQSRAQVIPLHPATARPAGRPATRRDGAPPSPFASS
jgi:hypothetical protein